MTFPDFITEYPEGIIRSLATVAWYRTDPLEEQFEQLAGDIAEAAGLDRAIVVRDLGNVADTLDRWADCNESPGHYAVEHEITIHDVSLAEFREAECDVLAADARSDVERLIEAARPKLAAVGS